MGLCVFKSSHTHTYAGSDEKPSAPGLPGSKFAREGQKRIDKDFAGRRLEGGESGPNRKKRLGRDGKLVQSSRRWVATYGVQRLL